MSHFPDVTRGRVLKAQPPTYRERRKEIEVEAAKTHGWKQHAWLIAMTLIGLLALVFATGADVIGPF